MYACVCVFSTLHLFHNCVGRMNDLVGLRFIDRVVEESNGTSHVVVRKLLSVHPAYPDAPTHAIRSILKVRVCVIRGIIAIFFLVTSCVWDILSILLFCNNIAEKGS